MMVEGCWIEELVVEAYRIRAQALTVEEGQSGKEAAHRTNRSCRTPRLQPGEWKWLEQAWSQEVWCVTETQPVSLLHSMAVKGKVAVEGARGRRAGRAVQSRFRASPPAPPGRGRPFGRGGFACVSGVEGMWWEEVGEERRW